MTRRFGWCILKHELTCGCVRQSNSRQVRNQRYWGYTVVHSKYGCDRGVWTHSGWALDATCVSFACEPMTFWN